MTEFKEGDRVQARGKTGDGNSMVFEGVVLKVEPDGIRVQSPMGVGILFKAEDLRAL